MPPSLNILTIQAIKMFTNPIQSMSVIKIHFTVKLVMIIINGINWFIGEL